MRTILLYIRRPTCSQVNVLVVVVMCTQCFFLFYYSNKVYDDDYYIILSFYLSALFASSTRKSLLSRRARGSRMSSLPDGASLTSGSLSDDHRTHFRIIH